MLFSSKPCNFVISVQDGLRKSHVSPNLERLKIRGSEGDHVIGPKPDEISLAQVQAHKNTFRVE